MFSKLFNFCFEFKFETHYRCRLNAMLFFETSPKTFFMASEHRLVSEMFETKTFQLKRLENGFRVNPTLDFIFKKRKF